jgi:hypothetical protein
MTVVTNLAGASNYVLQEAIGMYTDEAYKTAKKLSGTGLVGGNPQIDTNTETFIGQMRWHKPLNPVINNLSITNSANGSLTTTGTDYLTYVKAARSTGASKVNMQQVVTQIDGLAKFGRDFAETRAQDEHNAILSVLKGVALSELLNGAASGSGAAGLGGQTFENDPSDKRYGFYVDLGASKAVVDPTAAIQGASRAENFLRAMGMAWKDYEPDWAYLVTSPEMMASLRSANLVDETPVTDGSVNFSTIFQGKLRLVQTRASQGFTSADLTKLNTGAGIDVVGTKTSFIVLPGAVAMESLTMPVPTEITREGSSYGGGGTTTIWNRWGYVLAPAGYDWAGNKTQFASDADFAAATEGLDGNGQPVAKTVAGITTIGNARGTFARKTTSALSLGILPIFHS